MDEMSLRFYEIPDEKRNLVAEWFSACEHKLRDKIVELIIPA